MTALPPPTLDSTTLEIEALRAQLSIAEGAQQIAEVTLANERGAHVAEGVREAINDAIRGQRDAYNELDRVQLDYRQAYALLEHSQRALQALKDELVDSLLENRLLQRENMELAATSRLRYSLLPHSASRHHSSSRSTLRPQSRTPILKSSRVSATHPIPRSGPPAPSSSIPREELPVLPSYDDPNTPSWLHYSPPRRDCGASPRQPRSDLSYPGHFDMAGVGAGCPKQGTDFPTS